MAERTFPHLRDVLTAGPLPADKWIIEALGDALEVLQSDPEPHKWAHHQRIYHLWDGMPEDMARATEWAIDLVECPELVPAVWAAFDPLVAVEVELLLDQRAHPYPMWIGPRFEGADCGTHPQWSCSNCGTDRDNDAVALVIQGRPGYSDDLEIPIVYCADCVRMAADAMGDDER